MRSIRHGLLTAAGCAALAALSAPAAIAQPTSASQHTRAVEQATPAVPPTGRTHTDAIVPGVPYHLVETRTGRGVDFAARADEDYTLLADSGDRRGTAVVFTKKGDGYTVTSTRSRRSGYDTWCAVDNGIRLARKSECATVWRLSNWYPGFLLEADGKYPTYPAKGRAWLEGHGVDLPAGREFAYFKAVEAP
ncbi:hypothetical protein LRS74_28875 [Streptomyces sp. LX-29]|uniref:hypothetical protein n=1 Tax=Streptomyces sp. LX-29 TaxID=2900152 RepID=UPI00240E98C9|nr:hypothetical protein [Streptomyces sp. LX-29]WFB10600.1 hypothetical protein LRS74_28875 [Streptomyces sp. LX-29]